MNNRRLWTIGISLLAVGAYAQGGGTDVVTAVTSAGWWNLILFGILGISYLVGMGTTVAKVNTGVRPSDAANAGLWILIAGFILFSALYVIWRLGWSVPWWVWAIIGVVVLGLVTFGLTRGKK